MKIGEIAEQAGVNVQTVRFYERKKLLPEPARTESGYREYGLHELKQLLFIRQAKSLGFSLIEIRDIIQSRGRGECPCSEVVTIAERHLDNVRKQIQTLQKFKKELSSAVTGWKKAGKQALSPGAICLLIERTMESGKAPKKRADRKRRNDEERKHSRGRD